MMGHRSKRFKLFAETNLEALLPADNFYRQLEEKLDLSFVRDLVRDCYEEAGRPLGALAARAVERAIVRAAEEATGLAGVPSSREWRDTAGA